jgi:hypothetical protein
VHVFGGSVLAAPIRTADQAFGLWRIPTSADVSATVPVVSAANDNLRSLCVPAAKPASSCINSEHDSPTLSVSNSSAAARYRAGYCQQQFPSAKNAALNINVDRHSLTS